MSMKRINPTQLTRNSIDHADAEVDPQHTVVIIQINIAVSTSDTNQLPVKEAEVTMATAERRKIQAHRMIFTGKENLRETSYVFGGSEPTKQRQFH
ncbi:unnamed protein product [Dicrocoelium dendriticum]|nr:unnamed protein product [Dicrocoelium dendriticum]